MHKTEVIVAVGAEGGSLTLHGIRTLSGWVFSRHVLDQTPLMLDEKSTDNHTDFVDSWLLALELLSEYPWVDLYPLAVHREFGELILDAVEDAYAQRVGAPGRHLERWREIRIG